MRERRRDLGVSLRLLAEGAGVDAALVSRVERGRDARLSTWLRLYAAAGRRARLESDELCEESEGYLQDETAARHDRQIEGLCTGKRRRL